MPSNSTPRIGQRPSTSGISLPAGVITFVDATNNTINFITQNGQYISGVKVLGSNVPYVIGQHIVYANDTAGNTVVLGTWDSQQKINTQLYASVYRGTGATAQNTTTSGSGTTVNFNLVTSDAYSMWSTANNEFTVPVTGIYNLNCCVAFDSAVNSTGYRAVYINVSGSNQALNRVATAPAVDTYMNLSTTCKMLAGEKAHVSAVSSTAVVIPIPTGGNLVNFTISYIGPA